MADLSPAQRGFVELLIDRQALRFGDFTLKSGRKSPYFINTGCFNNGGDLARLGSAYAATVRAHFGDAVAVVFGPAYKGIPLALATAQAYEQLVGRPVGWAFDRKEAKDHGDGGMFVGAALTRDLPIVIVDDVITAGTALRESLAKLAATGARVLGAIVSVDRQEKGRGERSALRELCDESGIAVVPIVAISDAVAHLVAAGRLPAVDAERVRAHLAVAGAASSP
ncbi:MAG: orotate phosphoribosyltransferase [Planctomycetes bacterium]|nr:orotate phosphoribosyltransferase [Planctomycetota bacterium]